MDTWQAWGIMLLRVVLGGIFVMHGYHAFAVVGPRRLADMIVRMGNPELVSFVLAWYVIAAHVIGGILLILGLWTTVAALVQTPIMAAAVFRIHWPQGFFMRGALGEGGQPVAAGYAYALLVLAATVAIALTGPGALSVDEARRHRHHHHREMP
jgi:putative oxidoreductase